MRKLFSKRDILTFVVGIAIIQMLATLLMNRMMFHPVKGGYTTGFPGYVNIGTNGVDVAAIVLGPDKGEKAIIYCHGNAEDATAVCRFDGILTERYTIAAVDYPGYGLSSGNPTEDGCYNNVHMLYEWLKTKRGFESKDIFVIGYSIGSGVATELATAKPIGGLILEAPFLSAPRAITHARVLISNPFPNYARICNIKCPLIVIHGRSDRLVPYYQGKKLFEMANNPKWFFPVDEAGHADYIDCMGNNKYFSVINKFLEHQQL